MIDNMQNRYIKDSYTEQVHLVNSGDLNGSGRLFGGALLSWIDMVAGIVGRRHSNCNITTVFIDELHFIEPAFANELVVLQGKLCYVGNTSMEVEVKSFVEDLNGEKRLINKAYVVMVAIDKDGKPTAVPKLNLITDEEREEFEKGKLRQQIRKKK